MGIQINGTNDTISATDGGFNIEGSDIRLPSGSSIGVNGAVAQTPVDLISNSSGNGITVRGRSADGLGNIRFTSNNYGTLYGGLTHNATNLNLFNERAGSLILGSNGIDRVTIDSSGRVTTPYQPAFCASNQNGAEPSSNHSVTAFNSTFFNVGNHWDATNKRFTAPVTGTYLFTGHVIPTGLAQNTAFELWIAVNSSTVSTARRFLDRRKKTEADSNTFSVGGSVTIQLAANDWVQLTTTLATYSDETNCKFSGYLVG